MIAVVDASRARLFVHEREAGVGGLHEELAEAKDLVNPARRLRPSQLFSESSPGTNRSGSLQYGLDDHRTEHIDELDEGFSRDIVEAIAEELRNRPAQHLIVCASPRMLGRLRDKIVVPENIKLDEVARDLVKLTPAKLQDQLRSYGLLPQAALPGRPTA